DSRVVVESGAVSAEVSSRCIVSSTGIDLHETHHAAGGTLFGMALDGADVGSFDTDGDYVKSVDALVPELDAAAQRFVTKTTSALGAQKGESFRGTAVLSPEVVNDFVLGNLLTALSGRSVRTGKSPLGEKAGELIAAPLFHLVDDGRLPGGIASTAFDREGSPVRPMTIVDQGI
ncbi:MAG: TldD/PmbA family protein, partial [bacterium]|nr:TldD/PmbA family protein [bacterium]